MKQKVVTGLLWGAVAIIVLFFVQSPALCILLTFFCMLAVYEIERVAGVKNAAMIAVSVVFAGTVPVLTEYGGLLDRTNIPKVFFIAVYTILILVLMLIKFETTTFEHAAITVFASVAVPFALSTVVLVRDIAPEEHKGFMVFFGLSCAMMTDMFAYFTGVKLGKHKMAPKISPKKTVEGAIGGIVGTALLNTVLVLILNRFLFDEPFMRFGLLIPLSVGLSVIGMLGDLSASVLKRNYGVKDYGTIMPGHGGIMDRFDSSLFVMPCLYMFLVLEKTFR